MFAFLRSIYYFIVYYLFYKFSGAHHKPTSDSKYDPAVNHQKNFFHTLLRNYENSRFDLYRNLFPMTGGTTSLNTLRIIEINKDNVNRHLFWELTKGKTTPLVIRGLVRDSKAVREWGPEYFRNNYGDTKLIVVDRGQHKLSAYTSFNQQLDSHYMSIRDSIDNMRTTNGKFYINNVTDIFLQHPELIDDLNLDQLHVVDDAIDGRTLLKANMFMGGPGSGSSLHCAVGGNFFCNVHGKKKWVLMHPKYTPFLKSTPAKAFGFVISGYDLEDPNSIVSWNNHIPKYEVILEPGDVLFVPPWWWHYVHNETDFTIACAIRDHTVYWQSLSNNPMFMLMSPYIYKLHPWFLGLAQLIKGRDFLLRKSLESDKYIIGSLTGKTM